MKRLLTAIAVLVLIVLGCKTTKPPEPQPPTVPLAKGCVLTISALGVHLVSSMGWTNSQTGHSGAGSGTIYPEPGSLFVISTDPSISCATSGPTIAAVTFKCQGTNLPNAIPIVLPSACNGLQGTVNADCSNCTFSVSGIVGYDCYIYSPVRK